MDTPRADAESTVEGPEFNMTMEPSFQAPENPAGMFKNMRRGAKANLRKPLDRGQNLWSTVKHPQESTNDLDKPRRRHSLEFTPLLKSATRKFGLRVSPNKRDKHRTMSPTPALVHDSDDEDSAIGSDLATPRDDESITETILVTREREDQGDHQSFASSYYEDEHTSDSLQRPGRVQVPATLKEQQEMVNKYANDNFDLKLKIYHLENQLRVAQKQRYNLEDAMREMRSAGGMLSRDPDASRNNPTNQADAAAAHAEAISAAQAALRRERAKTHDLAAKLEQSEQQNKILEQGREAFEETRYQSQKSHEQLALLERERDEREETARKLYVTEKQRSALEEQVIALRGEVRQLTDDITQANDDKVAQEQNNGELQETIEEMSTTHTEERQALNADIQKMRQENRKLNKTIDEMERSYTERCNHQDAEIAKMERQLAEHEHEQKVYRGQASDQDYNWALARADLDRHKAEKTKLRQDVARQAQEHERVQTSTQTRIRELERELERKVKRKDAIIESHEKNKAALHEKLDSAAAYSKQQTMDRILANRNIANLQAQINERDEREGSLKAKLSEVQQSYEQLQRIKVELTRSRDEAMSTEKLATEQYRQLRLEDRKYEVNALERKNRENELVGKVRQARRKLSALAAEREADREQAQQELEAVKQQYVAQEQALRDEILTSQDSVRLAQLKRRQAEVEIYKVKDRQQPLEDEVIDFRHKLFVAERERDQLLEERKGKDKEAHALRSQVADAQQQLDQERRSLANTQTTVGDSSKQWEETLKLKVTIAQQKLNDERNKLFELQSEQQVSEQKKQALLDKIARIRGERAEYKSLVERLLTTIQSYKQLEHTGQGDAQGMDGVADESYDGASDGSSLLEEAAETNQHIPDQGPDMQRSSGCQTSPAGLEAPIAVQASATEQVPQPKHTISATQAFSTEKTKLTAKQATVPRQVLIPAKLHQARKHAAIVKQSATTTSLATPHEPPAVETMLIDIDEPLLVASHADAAVGHEMIDAQCRDDVAHDKDEATNEAIDTLAKGKVTFDSDKENEAEETHSERSYDGTLEMIEESTFMSVTGAFFDPKTPPAKKKMAGKGTKCKGDHSARLNRLDKEMRSVQNEVIRMQSRRALMERVEEHPGAQERTARERRRVS